MSNIHFESALKKCEQEKYQEAIVLFEKSIHLSPHHIESWYNKGMAYLQLENYPKAIADFDKALSFFGANATILSQRGVAKHLNKNHKEALEDFDTAQNIEPNNPYRYSSRAYVKAIIGDTYGAIEDYKKAVQLDENDAVAWNNLGLLEEKLGYKTEAKQKFDTADSIADKGKTFEKPSIEQIIKEYEIKQKEIETSLAMQNNPNPPLQKGIKGYWQVIKKVFTDKKTSQDFWDFAKNLGRKS
ncbi:MAG: tetratricopeptide repeat protein [Bacteroidetes bacterium]|nr:MAG: tetratricopeptide repeat protein [Bacteroidota bacterium]TAG86418.1 MAG: tetratricopeptide repeat protein [Bacteroidota bacterium]